MEEVQQKVGLASVEAGLNSREAHARLKKNGPNSLKTSNRLKPIKMLLGHIFNFMNLVLFGAVAISLAVQEWIDAGVVGFVIFLNIVIGVVQDLRSERTMKALQNLSQSECNVTRDGSVSAIQTGALVVGDVIQLKEGDIVPADVRLFRLHGLLINESSLTGESDAIEKKVDVTFPEETPIADQLNMAYSGTVVTKGKGKGIVVRTAFQTEIGKIAKSLHKTKTKSPKIVRRMNLLGLFLVFLGAVAFGFMLLGVGIHKQVPFWPEGVKAGITTLVAIVPESLAPVLTLTMSIGVVKMVKEKAIVRKMTALESLGNVTNICTDKTGTLTQGRMQMTTLVVAGERFEVTGAAVEPVGELLDSSGKNVTQNLSQTIRMSAMISSLCNASTVKQLPVDSEKSKKNRKKSHRRRNKKTLKQNEWVAVGSPTEIALQVFGSKLGMGRTALLNPHHEDAPFSEIIREYSFDSSIKRMTCVLRSRLPEYEGKYLIVSKGAPDVFMNGLCTKHIVSHDMGTESLDEQSVKSILSTQEIVASEGLRTLCLAFRLIPIEDFEDKRETVEQDLTFVGMCGIYDPPREAVPDSIRIAHGAGIIVHMVTGDHASTALSIAKQIGIIKDPHTQSHLVMTASQFDKLSDEDLKQMDHLPLVIARCTPESKVKLVKALHARKRTVAMTGDGTNDAAAIKVADVGIAMGVGGSDVTKEAADIVLTDDDFASIVVAIEEGRRVFSSIRKFIIHLLTGNVAQTIVLVISMLAGLRPPINPTQVLFLNMISAGPPPSIALGASNDDVGIMDRHERPVHEDLFTKDTVLDISWYGITMGLLVLGCFLYADRVMNDTYQQSQTVAFASLTVMMLLQAYNCRNRFNPFFEGGFYASYKLHLAVFFGLAVTAGSLYIPWVNSVMLHQSPLDVSNLLIVFVSAIIFMTLSELYKGFKRSFRFLVQRMRSDHQDEVDVLYNTKVNENEEELDDLSSSSSDDELCNMPPPRDNFVVNVKEPLTPSSRDSRDSTRGLANMRRPRTSLPPHVRQSLEGDKYRAASADNVRK